LCSFCPSEVLSHRLVKKILELHQTPKDQEGPTKAEALCKQIVTFSHMLPSPNHQARGPPLVGCKRLLICSIYCNLRNLTNTSMYISGYKYNCNMLAQRGQSQLQMYNQCICNISIITSCVLWVRNIPSRLRGRAQTEGV
jgi:hypothetical protein